MINEREESVANGALDWVQESTGGECVSRDESRVGCQAATLACSRAPGG